MKENMQGATKSLTNIESIINLNRLIKELSLNIQITYVKLPFEKFIWKNNAIKFHLISLKILHKYSTKPMLFVPRQNLSKSLKILSI